MTWVLHTPVLLNEAVELLDVKKGAWFVDTTAGGGGHTRELLRKGSNVLAIDRDAEAVERLKRNFAEEIQTEKLKVVKGRFGDLDTLIEKAHVDDIRGVLFDLGMSTHQLQESGRGFSFLRDELLDMRMDTTQTFTAKEIINEYSETQLYEIFRKFGEELKALDITRAIIRTRTVSPIETTSQLASLIQEVYTKNRVRQHIHPATRVFQALRIAVNDELSELRTGLPKAINVIKPGGRIAVISFHSLEDRIVKQYFLEESQLGRVTIVTHKPVRSTPDEIRKNPAARSGKLRVAEKIN